MTGSTDTKRDTKSPKNNRTERLSPDGKWRSFPKVPNLLQYVSTGVYYGRVKVNGKLSRRSLETDVFTTAKLKVRDFIKAEIERAQAGPMRAGTFGAALRAYLQSLNASNEIGAPTKKYYRDCIRVLLKSWSGLRSVALETLTLQRTDGESYKGDSVYLKVQHWASELSGKVEAQYFNNILGRLRLVLEIGGIPREKNPAFRIKRMGIKREALTLPEPEQFLKIIEAMETSGAGQQQECADFARFLAFSGCRLSEARTATWADVDLAKGFLTVHGAKIRKNNNKELTRKVPIIPDMRHLLERLQNEKPKPTDSICRVGECEKSLARACKIVKVLRLTHHDLRHLFATRCIEAGVDIPTVSRWLGHSDGGALAMRVYGHLREKHSAEMAAKVTFTA
jgi:integrase